MDCERAGESYVLSQVAVYVPLIVFFVVVFLCSEGITQESGENGRQPVRSSEQERPIVRDIRFEGLERYSPGELASRMKTEEGEPFREEVLRSDIRRLYRDGFVKRVRWQTEKEKEEGGLRLTLQVAENPRLEDVRLEGLEALTGTKVREDLKILTSKRLNSYTVNRDKRTLKDKYREKGYHFVQVNDRVIEGEEGGGKILVLEVVEGPQVAVEEVTVQGTEAYDADTLVDLMDSEPTWIFGSTRFSKEKLDRDVKKIKQFYRKNGYLDASVRVRELRFSPDKQEVYITLTVKEGPQYQIESVEFSGNTLFSREKLLQQIELRSGNALQLRKMALDRRSIRTLYGKRAYIDTEVDWNYEVIPETNRVRLNFQITEHGTTTAGRIDIRGNDKTKEHVIRREIEVEPGQPIDLTKLRESRQNLRGTRYFSKVEQERVPTDKPGVEDLVYNVEETSTGQLQFGGGFSSDAGIVGLFKISQKNFDIANVPESFDEILGGTGFAGGGQTLNITIRPGVEQSRFSINFREPYVYDQPIGMDVGLSLFDREFDDFSENRSSANLGLDYRDEDWTYSMGFEFENIEITNVETGSPTDIRNIDGKFDLYSVTPGVELDRRNRPFVPTSGYLLRTNFRSTFGDFNFGKWTVDAKKLFTLYSRPTSGSHVLTLSTNLGHIEAYDDGGVPSFDRFYAGGAKTIRGFDFRTVSPKVRGVEVGGNSKWVATAEYTFPIVRNRVGGRWRDFVRGAVFVDTGTVSETFSGFDQKIRSAVGFGVRIKIPGMGPVPFALDFGFPIDKEDEDDEQLISFDINAGF